MHLFLHYTIITIIMMTMIWNGLFWSRICKRCGQYVCVRLSELSKGITKWKRCLRVGFLIIFELKSNWIELNWEIQRESKSNWARRKKLNKNHLWNFYLDNKNRVKQKIIYFLNDWPIKINLTIIVSLKSILLPSSSISSL